MGAILPEKPIWNQAFWVQPVQKGVCVLFQRGRVDDQFVPFGGFGEELVDSWALHDEDLAEGVVDLHGEDEVAVLHDLEAWMDEGFI